MYVNYVNSCFTLIYIIKHGMCSMQGYTLFDNQRENKGSLRWHKFGWMVQFSIWTLEKNLAWISLVLSLSVLNFSILNSLCTLLDYTSFFGVLFYLSKQQKVTCVLLLLTISCLESHVKVMRIKGMITYLISSWSLNKFSLTAPQDVYGEQYGGYACWC